MAGGLVRLADRLSRLRPWRRFAASIGLGALSALAMPPLGAFPVLVFTFPGLIWLMAGVRSFWGAFGTGWGFTFGLLLVGLYWVPVSMLVDPAFYWMIPFTAAGLPAGMALYHGLTLAIWWRLPLAGVGRLIAFAVMWSAAEWLRGHALTGFPWHLIGYTWVDWLPMIQSVSIFGSYGLSLLTVLAASLPAAWITPAGRDVRGLIAWLISLAVIGCLGIWGAARLSNGTMATVEDVRLRLVQPNISQLDKMNRDLWADNFGELLILSTAPAADPESLPPTHVIWPETALPYLAEEDDNARAAIASAAPPGGTVLTGLPRRVIDGTGQYFYNGMIAVDDQASVIATYDKHHLVPFGEYMPLSDWIPLRAIAGRQFDYSFGTGPQTLTVPGLPPVSPMICYEAIFPGNVVDADERPGWLLNITNDGWFGQTAGPHQHFAIARARAVEEGLPLIRVAGTGISGVTDAYGRIWSRLGVDERGVIDTPLPVGLPATTYARTGDYVYFTIMLVLLILAATIGITGDKKTKYRGQIVR
jgi:apolipoprotein N-acyltransferase